MKLSMLHYQKMSGEESIKKFIYDPLHILHLYIWQVFGKLGFFGSFSVLQYRQHLAASSAEVLDKSQK